MNRMFRVLGFWTGIFAVMFFLGGHERRFTFVFWTDDLFRISFLFESD